MLVARSTRFNVGGQVNTKSLLLSRSRRQCPYKFRQSGRVITHAKSSSKSTTEEEESDEPKITLKGLSQLIAMGLGSPLSGDLKEINLNDPKRTVVFELDANNFEDADGNPISQGKYRDEGYVAGKDDAENTTSIFNVILPLTLAAVVLGFVVWTLQQL